MYYTTEMTNKQEENLQPSDSKNNKVNKSNQDNKSDNNSISKNENEDNILSENENEDNTISENEDNTIPEDENHCNTYDEQPSEDGNDTTSIPNQIIDKQIGIRLKKKRSQLYISQTQLATALGLTFQQIQKYEKGINRLSCSRMLQIARILQVDSHYFFDGLITEIKQQDDDCNNNNNNSEQEISGFNTAEVETEGNIEGRVEDNITTENKTRNSIIKTAINLDKDPIIRKIRILEKEVWRIRAEEKTSSSYGQAGSIRKSV